LKTDVWLIADAPNPTKQKQLETNESRPPGEVKAKKGRLRKGVSENGRRSQYFTSK
jgi:hypothetical protein